jgi:tetratricopeptide (TPR) repeat protein
MKQTDEYIYKNIVRIMDVSGSTQGTGFLIRKEYCVTCHHNICELNAIYVGKHKKEKFAAEWISQFSNMAKDLAILRVKDCPYEPLRFGSTAYAGLDAVIIGFPIEKWESHVSPYKITGRLGGIQEDFRFDGDEVKGDHEYNKKPDAIISGYSIKPDSEADENEDFGFAVGLSGSPVCYKEGLPVIGMFVGIDENSEKGYMLPIEDILEQLEKTEDSVAEAFAEVDVKGIINNGNMYFHKADFRDAIKEYDKILSDLNYQTALHNKGRALIKLKRFEEAVECYDRAIEINQNDMTAWHNKGFTLNGLGEYYNALKCFERSLEIAPNNPYSWNSKGNAHIRLNQYTEALECYNKAISLDRTYADPWNGMGNIYYEEGKHAKALECYNKAISLDRTYADPWRGKANVFRRLNKHRKAVECYNKAITLDPTTWKIWNNRGRML